MSGSNVVPLTGPCPPAVWPPTAPPYPPAFPPGCCPPGGMDALMKCYCDIQSSMQFISAIMIDLINNNPAVTDAIVAAIEKSGSALPLIGVTDGSAAQPGQVGEFIEFDGVVAIPASGGPSVVTLGSLPAGDWNCWAWATVDELVENASFFLNPLPAGFVNQMNANPEAATGSPTIWFLMGLACRALTSAPSLIAFTCATAGPMATNMRMRFYARRSR